MLIWTDKIKQILILKQFNIVFKKYLLKKQNTDFDNEINSVLAFLSFISENNDIEITKNTNNKERKYNKFKESLIKKKIK